MASGLWGRSVGIWGSIVWVGERTLGGRLYLRWWSPRKKSFIYRSLRHRDRVRGLEAAERLSSRLRAGAEAGLAHYTTFSRLLRLYSANRTPQKKPTTQREDERRAEMVLRVFGSETLVKSISRAMWDQFIHLRSTGTIDGRGRVVAVDDRKPVGARTVEADLRWIKAVCSWATNWQTPDGHYLLDVSPVRGFPIPRELNPCRPIATEDRYLATRAVSDSVMMTVSTEEDA